MREVAPTVIERQIQSEDATVILSLEEMIKSHISSIERLKVEKKKKNEMLQDGFQNDVNYKQDDDRVKNATKARTRTKEMLMKMPSMVKLSNEVKSMSTELKEKQIALSDYLLEYQRLTKANQLELFDGEFVEIVNTAKVIKKRK